MNPARRAAMMGSLVFAGESIYMLPYALRREFQPTMLEAMELTNLELGYLNSVFGVLALLCYFPGGWLADRSSIRSLLTLSLLATGLSGFYMASLPSLAGLVALYAFWGVFSILTFWAALIKATRWWGGTNRQGRAFGLLDGGRGVVSAGLAFVGIALFTRMGAGAGGLRAVIVLYSTATVSAALLAWLFVPKNLGTPEGTRAAPAEDHGWRGRLATAARMPVVWLQAVVILTAYMGYWGTFDISAFAVDAWGRDQVFGATLSASAVWLRPVAAIAVGLVADRVDPSRAVIACFGSMVLCFGLFALVPTEESLVWILWANAAAIGAAVFALRGLYYALLEECAIPMALTGTTVGIVSVVGYTPDVFTPLLQGWLLDAYPGAPGHQAFFGTIAAGAAIGLGASLGIRRIAQGSTPVPAA